MPVIRAAVLLDAGADPRLTDVQIREPVGADLIGGFFGQPSLVAADLGATATVDPGASDTAAALRDPPSSRTWLTCTDAVICRWRSW
ncbi:hypothetical protein [Mycobacterium sp. IDR2000157661]|uniref:hypothetical protein n=1 Tax=Mycobacterium sp. IDR2000157661 TaxID=2867005 RepID=UPI001EEC41D6|nr:hypothetical protein [Mycobacterium sp. IDR2000157661]ULE33520.1 hypothetical protein K3G64_02045 [Mycobacterium sp. IDR2000157661]